MKKETGTSEETNREISEELFSGAAADREDQQRAGVVDFITTAKFSKMPDELLLEYAEKDDLSDAETDTVIRELKRRNLLQSIKT